MKKKIQHLNKLITPFEEVHKSSRNAVMTTWFSIVVGLWFMAGMRDTHIFPSITQVLSGFKELYRAGLITHIMSSLALCGKAILISIPISLAFSYLSTLPLIKPISVLISKFRYLPLTGISFYITMLINDARSVQVWILVTFMSTFLITSLLGVIQDTPAEELDHARTLGYSRWNILWEVIVKGRFDYIIETVRQNLAIVWMMIVTVESISAATGGLGLLIKNSDKFMNHGRIIALQLVILLTGLGIDFSLTGIRKLLFRYSKI